MHRLVGEVLLVVSIAGVSACGGASVRTETAPRCEAEARSASDAREAAEACASAVDTPVFPHEDAYRAATTAIDAYEAALSEATVQAAAESLYLLLDRVSPELTDHTTLDRAENATERFLRERGDRVRAAAITEVRASIDAIRLERTPPPTPRDCTADDARRDEAARALDACEHPRASRQRVLAHVRL